MNGPFCPSIFFQNPLLSPYFHHRQFIKLPWTNPSCYQSLEQLFPPSLFIIFHYFNLLQQFIQESLGDSKLTTQKNKEITKIWFVCLTTVATGKSSLLNISTAAEQNKGVWRNRRWVLSLMKSDVNFYLFDKISEGTIFNQRMHDANSETIDCNSIFVIFSLRKIIGSCCCWGFDRDGS